MVQGFRIGSITLEVERVDVSLRLLHKSGLTFSLFSLYFCAQPSRIRPL
jgi:hypothetical protein